MNPPKSEEAPMADAVYTPNSSSIIHFRLRPVCVPYFNLYDCHCYGVSDISLVVHSLPSKAAMPARARLFSYTGNCIFVDTPFTMEIIAHRHQYQYAGYNSNVFSSILAIPSERSFNPPVVPNWNLISGRYDEQDIQISSLLSPFEARTLIYHGPEFPEIFFDQIWGSHFEKHSAVENLPVRIPGEFDDVLQSFLSRYRISELKSGLRKDLYESVWKSLCAQEHIRVIGAKDFEKNPIHDLVERKYARIEAAKSVQEPEQFKEPQSELRDLVWETLVVRNPANKVDLLNLEVFDEDDIRSYDIDPTERKIAIRGETNYSQFFAGITEKVLTKLLQSSSAQQPTLNREQLSDILRSFLTYEEPPSIEERMREEAAILREIGFSDDWISLRLNERWALEKKFIEPLSCWVEGWLENLFLVCSDDTDLDVVFARFTLDFRERVYEDWKQNGTNPLLLHIKLWVMNRINPVSPEFKQKLLDLASSCGVYSNLSTKNDWYTRTIPCLPCPDAFRKKAHCPTLLNVFWNFPFRTKDLLFHATSWAGLENILIKGPRAEGAKNQDFSDGDGMYFSFDFNVALDWCNNRYQLFTGLCAILVYECEGFTYRNGPTGPNGVLLLNHSNAANKQRWKDVIITFRRGRKINDYEFNTPIEGCMCRNSEDVYNGAHPRPDENMQVCFRSTLQLRQLELSAVVVFMPEAVNATLCVETGSASSSSGYASLIGSSSSTPSPGLLSTPSGSSSSSVLNPYVAPTAYSQIKPNHEEDYI